MADDVNDFFMGNSAPSLSFLEIGTTHEGTITHKTMAQARDIQTKEGLTWPDGNPKMQAVITIQTTERDPQVENDNGLRRLFVGSGGMRNAITAAIKKSGATGLEVGGRLGVRYTRDGEATTRGFNPPKVYAARYEPPPPVAEDDGYFEDTQLTPQNGPVAQNTPDVADFSDEPF